MEKSTSPARNASHSDAGGNAKSGHIKVIEPPKIPLNFGKKPTILPGSANFGPKPKPMSKFNQSTFHTQHKGGPAAGGTGK
jgi:hypothetical protein